MNKLKVWRHTIFTPLPVTKCHTFSDPLPPLERDILYGRPLTETHLSQDIDDNEINIENYTLFRIDRNRHGGGIAIYCRSELEPTLISSLNVQGIEIFWIQVTVQKNKILFGTCYRPPNQTADERKIFIDGLHSTFETIIDKIKKPFVLLGDFNDRWNNTWGRDHTDSELKFDLVNLINDFNLTLLLRR